MRPSGSHDHHTTYAVASLGRGRWYWVVWPSLALLRSKQPPQHMADGYASTKAEAVERALRLIRDD